MTHTQGDQPRVTVEAVERAICEQGDDVPEITDEQASKVAVLLSTHR
jgi:hypothetical protein